MNTILTGQMINDYFDKVYLLNLYRRLDRLQLSKKRLDFCDIKYSVFNGTDGSVVKKLWKSLSNPNFANSNYIGCAISHLSIYKDAIENGYKRILILEDDNRIKRDANDQFRLIVENIPIEWDLLYLGFIPLSDDCSRWDYNLVNNFLSKNIFYAKNLWGLYSYGISEQLMKDTIDEYNENFPMELDRYFVTRIQPNGKSFGVTPQLFAADDGFSDNSGKTEISMLQRSVDTRYTKLTDYI